MPTFNLNFGVFVAKDLFKSLKLRTLFVIVCIFIAHCHESLLAKYCMSHWTDLKILSMYMYN